MFPRDRRSNRGENITAEWITQQIDELYEKRKQMTKTSGAIIHSHVHKNILLIGRTRSGKTTLKNILSNPCYIPNELTVVSQTSSTICGPEVSIPDSHINLKIVDTPGLFDRRSISYNGRNGLHNKNDRQNLWEINEYCYQMNITKFHLVFFCASFEAGINDQDIQALRQFITHFGREIGSRLCLIITRCESKEEWQRTRLRDELAKDIHFRDIVDSFGRGIYFSGALSRDAYNNRDLEVLTSQFETICDYREELIALIRNANDTFPIQPHEPKAVLDPLPSKRNDSDRRTHRDQRKCCELL